jgi:tetratricopeptide (TPR) repeat protein
MEHYKNGAYEHAIADFTEAIRLDPNYMGAYINRGSVYHDKGDIQKANKDFAFAESLGDTV